MNLIQELLNILDRKEDKKSLDLKKDWFEFGRSKSSSVGNPLYSPKMTPHAIRFDNLVASIEENLSATSEIGKAIYNIKYSNDNSVVPANGQVIYNQASREIYVSKIDALGNDREIAFDTILLTEGNPGVKPVGLFWANQLNPWTSYSSQYFNTCGSEFLKFICVEPTPGDTFIFNPGNGPVGDNGGAGIPINLVYAQTEQGLMTGGSGASLVTVYIEPLIASQTIQVARRNAAGIQFVFEQIASPAALMTAYYNQDYVTVDPSIAGNNWWGMYTDSAMTSPVGDGFYMLHTEWLAMSGGDHGHITSISGGNYLQTSKTFLNTTLNDPSGDPDLVCTAVTRSLNITKHVSGDYYIIPWIETQQQGLYKPSNFEKAFFVLDMAGSNVCGFGANGSGAAETITDVAYDSNQNILAHLDESGVIALMPLNGNDYTLEMNGTDLKLLKEGTVVNTIDLSIYLDDTNLARLVNGVLDASTGIASFIRDDGSTFTVDFSSLLDTNDIDYISNIQLVNTDLQIQGVGNAFSGVIDLSSIASTTPVMSSTITGTGKLWDDTIQLVDAEPVSEVVSRTYGVQFNPDKQLVVNVPWQSGSVIIANPGGGSTNLTSISIDGVSYSISTGTAADGNDFISNVLFNDATNELTFTGSGGAFSGVIDLSGLSGTTYTASNGIELVTPTEFGLINVTRTDTTNAIAPNHTDSFTVIDDIKTNSKGQVTDVNTKTITLPASGTGADGVITNVALSGTDLVFTGSNGGFNGTVSLSTLGADGNATYTLGLVASGANDTVVKLTGANGGASSQFTLAGGAGISITENTSTNTIVIENTVTDTNDIDYVSNVALSGSSLDFTGIGNGFNGSVDLSSLSTVETLTRLSINANTLTYIDENGANTDIDLSLYLDDTNLARLVSGTLDGATGIATFSRDDASTFTVDFSSLIDVDTNDIDYVRTVALNGTSLDFTGVGNAFAGSIDLSSLSGATYTAGTYLTLTGGAFNHNATTRSNTTSAASPAAGASFTVIDSVVTNSTGHITDVNTKTVTLPLVSAVACVGGLTIRNTQALTSTKQPIQDSLVKLGFISNAPDTRHYNLVWTIEYGTTGVTGVKQFITSVRVTPNGGTPVVLIDWRDSAYMVSEFGNTSSYSYTLNNFSPGDSVEILVAGSTDVQVLQSNLSATIVECEGFTSNEIRTIQADVRGEDPGPTSYNYYNVRNCASDTSGIMAVPTSITGVLALDGAQYRYTLDNASLINMPWDNEMMVRVQSQTVAQIADFTVTALTRDTCPLT